MRHRNAGRKFDRNTQQPPRHVAQPGGESHPARANRDDRRQGQGAAARGGATDHQGARLGCGRLHAADELSADDGPGASPPRERSPRTSRASGYGSTKGAPKRVDLVEKVLVELAKRYRGASRAATRASSSLVRVAATMRRFRSSSSLNEGVPHASDAPAAGGAKIARAATSTATAAEPRDAAKVE